MADKSDPVIRIRSPHAARRGFSLLELMMTMAVFGVLTATAFPFYTDAMLRGRRAEAKAALMKVMQQQERSMAQTGSYVAFNWSTTTDEAGRYPKYSGENAISSAYELDAYACGSESLRTCIEVRAQPGTARVRSFSDPGCGTFTLRSTGVKTPTVDRCW